MKKELCQSCGMPLSIENRGLNADKSPNEEYCHYCFHNGEFTEPKLTLELQIKKLTEMAVLKLNLSQKEALNMANETLPKLKRWK
ncbi:MAG: transcriptional regulator [Bacteroidetes bacterium]|nr:MAG: transcriptional regulator [Bacteroidota bacterium]